MSTLRKQNLRRLASTMTIRANDPFVDTTFFEHHGILGMRWGIRRFQNKDGSLKPAGKKRYNGEEEETRDKGLGPGAQKQSSSSGKQLATVAAIAGGTALAASTVAATKAALGETSYKDMDDKQLAEATKRKALENTYKKQHGIKDSPADAIEAGNKALEAAKKFNDADKVPNNPNQNRYNTRQTMTQKEMDSMSDQDLQKLVNRMNLETQYSRLTSDPPTRSKVDVGLEKAQAVLAITASAVTIGAAAYNIHQKMASSKVASSVGASAWERAQK